jgi:Rhs element Vgr protein
MKIKLSKICGKLKVAGNPDVKAGSVITLKGLSDRFNGNVFVTGVQQQFSVDHWFTEIQFGWNNDWFYKNDDIIEKPSSGLVPGINGLHTGIVTKLESDPDGEHRIKVKVPLINNDEEGIWARIATLDAGKDRGSFFLPEIGDEVVLGFINDDPRHAIILGMLHSQAMPAPVTASDKNNEKGFYTRSKMKLVFDDDKKSISLITEGGNSLIMEDQQGSIEIKDKSGNKIKMGSDGITIESATALKAKGNTQVELTSSATMTIKGTLVQIN